jgi:hypothetical protein
MQPHLHFAVVMSQQLHGHTELAALGLPIDLTVGFAGLIVLTDFVGWIVFFITLTTLILSQPRG